MQTIDRIFKAQLDIKKSNFLAFLCPISEFKSLHERLKEEHFKAVHVVWATRELNKYGQIIENQSDDGEPKGTSGQPSLNALRGADLINVGVLVVRYFGGIKLGTGGLVRAYSGAVNEVINKAIKDGGVMKFETKDEVKFFTPFSLMSRFEHYFATKNLSEFEREFNDSGAIWSVNLNEAEFAELFKFCKEFEASEFKFLALALSSKSLFAHQS